MCVFYQHPREILTCSENRKLPHKDLSTCSKQRVVISCSFFSFKGKTAVFLSISRARNSRFSIYKARHKTSLRALTSDRKVVNTFSFYIWALVSAVMFQIDFSRSKLPRQGERFTMCPVSGWTRCQ